MSENDFELKDGIKLIFLKKKIIIGVTLLCMVIAGVIGVLMPETYRSSLILEVGRIFFPPGGANQKLQFIEDPGSIGKLIESSGVLEEVRRRLNMNLLIPSMRGNLEVKIYSDNKLQDLPILKLLYDSRSPQESVAVLNILAEIIIARHSEKYGVYRKGLEERITNNREKVAAFQKIISAQIKYKDLSQKYITRGEISAADFIRELQEVSSSQTSAVDMLFLQSSALSEKQITTELTQFQAQMDLEIGRKQQDIAAARMEIADTRSRIALSSPTGITSAAILPKRSVKPKKVMMVAIAGLIGLAFSILLIFFREYLKE